jgi:lysylphosphatidylglycerol synthetase-like protein (DUF2156 family)
VQIHPKISGQFLIVSKLVRQQRFCQVLLAVACSHFLLVSLNLPGWPCPVRHGLGIPCPGCGMTRAIAALVKGDWSGAMAIHAFAPFALLTMAFIAAAALLPHRQTSRLSIWVAQVEKRTGISLILTLLFVTYWLIRLIFFNHQLYLLVM